MQNEKKEVKVDEILGADVARKAVSDAMVRSSHLTLVPHAPLNLAHACRDLPCLVPDCLLTMTDR